MLSPKMSDAPESPRNFAPIRNAWAIPSGFGLLGVFDPNSELRAVAQIIVQHRQIFRRGNDQHFPQPAEHQRGQRITNHRLVVNREKLFADDLGQRKKTRPAPPASRMAFFIFDFRFSIFDRCAPAQKQFGPLLPETRACRQIDMSLLSDLPKRFPRSRTECCFVQKEGPPLLEQLATSTAAHTSGQGVLDPLA